MTHDDHEMFREECDACRAEMDDSYRYAMRSERELQQSLRLARQDLDMAGIDEWPELMDAIQRRLKR